MLSDLFSQPFRHRSHVGIAVVVASLLVSYGLWIGSMAWAGDWYEDRWKYAAKVGSHGCLLLMCWAFLLATRFRPIEWLFGGLDKVYKAHRIVGEAAFFLIFLHPVFLAAHRMADGPGAFFSYFLAWDDPVRMTGLLALAAFCFLVVLSIYWKIAYHKWKRTHDFFGLLFVLVLVHAVWSGGEIVRYPALQIWFGFWCATALAAYVYIRLLYRWVGPQFDYTVTKIRDAGNEVTEIFFRPEGRRMRHEPGQFLYVSFDADAVSEEPHPFTISSPPEAEELRLSIKALGDWTSNVSDIKPGEQARIWGPYGHLGEALWKEPEKPAVFLAGGIGITPFLGKLSSRRLAGRAGSLRVVYSVESRDKAIYLSEIEESTAQLRDAKVLPHFTDEEGFIDREWLEERLGELRGATYFLCGPGPMNDAMKEILLDAGVPLEDVHFELFEIR